MLRSRPMASPVRFMLLTTLLALALGMLAACGGQQGAAPAPTTAIAPTDGSRPASSQKLRVVATTTIVGDVVQNIGGDLIELTVLMPPGVDPHSFEFTPQDVAKVADSDIVFANGLGLEEFMSSLLENAGTNVNMVTVSEGVKTIPFGKGAGHGENHANEHAEGTPAAEGEHSDEHTEGTPVAEGEHAGEEEHGDEHGHEGGADPHVWWNPLNVAVWTDNIAQALSAKDGANAETYAANATAYKAKLQELDSWISAQVGQLPETERQLVTDHDTFGYLADRYGFELVGAVLPSASTQGEPSAQELAALQDAIKAYNVRAIFVGTTVSSSLAQRIADDTGTKLVPTYTDSLSEPGGDASTYLEFARTTVTTIVEALK